MGRSRKNKKNRADGKKLPVAPRDYADDCFPRRRENGNQKWRGKNLYLRCLDTTRIWGIQAFRVLDTDEAVEKVVDEYGEFQFLSPSVVCDWDYFNCGFPLEMGVFTFAGKAYMVGGETRAGGLLPPDSHGDPDEELGVPSDKVYEFRNPPMDTLLELPDVLRLPGPMRCPIVAKINGSVYALFGDYRGLRRPAFPSASSHSFAVLEKDDGRSIDQCRWRPLPTPPFYQKGTPDYSSGYKSKIGVIGHKLYLCSSSGRNYAFDADTGEWESSGVGYEAGTETVSSMLKLNVQMGSHQPRRQHECFVVVAAEIFVSDLGAYVALVDGKTGRELHEQKLPEAYDVRLPVCAFQVIELEEEEEEEEHDGDLQLSSTFCFVYTTYNHLVGLTVLRFSLPPAAAASSETSKQKLGTSSMNGKAGGGGIHLNVEVLEKRLYKYSEPCPAQFDAFFL